MDEVAIFSAAVEKQEPEERRAFLQATCGEDRELLARIEGLLWAHDHPDTFLVDPVERIINGNVEDEQAATCLKPITEQPGDTIGPYKLREQIGEGGFGIVYVAEQREPIQRKVALKLIKPGMDSREIIARFEAERQALAMMDHPHIAKVLDAGTTDEGRPYFVMELVNGLPLTKFCNQQKLSMTERLRLFVDVCRAVQHAHQKGVIHRDIKPSNVLVTLHDGKPVAKVIDFGVAKALSQKLTEQTLYTALGQMVGTPLYMSPEQAEMSGLNVDTRSDIYSLGVLLYELLTGTTPFDKESLKNAGYAQVQQIIRETEPVKPSGRLSTLKNEDRSTVCDERQIDQRKLEQALRGDLDWVVMKALEKDRERRYTSVADFADDVERYLTQRPVVAGPPSSLYRLRRHLRRHKLALTATALVLLSMIAGTGFSVWYALEAHKARDEARVSEGLANERLRLLQDEQAKSERHFTLAKDAVAELVDEVARLHLAAYPELAKLRETLLATAAKFYSDLLREAPDDVNLLLSRGEVRRNLNRHDAALEDFLAAVEQEPGNSQAHLALARFYRNSRDTNLRDADLALKHNQRAIALAPDDAEAWYHLAWVYAQAFGDEERGSQAMFRSAELTTIPSQRYFRLGIAQRHQRCYAEAVASLTAAIELGPRDCHLYIQRGHSYESLGRMEQAIQDYTRAIQINAFEPLAFRMRARAWMDLGEYALAAADWEQSHQLVSNVAPRYRDLFDCYLRMKAWDKAAALLDGRTGEESKYWNLVDGKASKIIDASQDEALITARDRFLDRVELHFRSALVSRELDDPETLNRVAWYLCTCPQEESRDIERAVELARKATEQAKGSFQIAAWNTYGVALYYAGRYEDSIEALLRSDELKTGEEMISYNAIFLAMAYWQLNQPKHARGFLQIAEKRIAEEDPDHPDLIRFRQEARQLIPSEDSEKQISPMTVHTSN